MRLARGFAGRERLRFGAQRRHRIGDRGEHRTRGGIFLDHVGPPGFAVVVARRRCQRADRIAADRIVVGARCRLVLDAAAGHAQPVRCRQVDEAQWCAVAHRPARGLIFRRVLGEGEEAGVGRVVLGIDEQGHRRRHVGIGEHRQQLRCFRGPLDQHRRRLEVVKRLHQPPRRSRPVVANAEQEYLARHGLRSGRSTRRNSPRTRAASSARSRDIRRAPRYPAPGPSRQRRACWRRASPASACRR